MLINLLIFQSSNSGYYIYAIINQMISMLLVALGLRFTTRVLTLLYTVGGVLGLTLGMAEEFRDYGISCNTLWPATYIATAAVEVNLGGEGATQVSRKPEIMADAAYAILNTARGELTGQSLLDEEALARVGVTDLRPYSCVPGNDDKLQRDFFLD